MNPDTDMDDVLAALQRVGIEVRASDIPFLRRTLYRQRELLRIMGEQVQPETEPAHVFRPGACAAPSADAGSGAGDDRDALRSAKHRAM